MKKRFRWVWIGFVGLSSVVSLASIKSAAASAEILNCPECQLLNRVTVASPLSAPVAGNEQTMKTALDVSQLFLARAQVPQAGQGQAVPYQLTQAKSEDFGPALPGAFPMREPISISLSDFQPVFKTSYYDPLKGPINVPSAPWNFGVSPRQGAMTYDYGMAVMGLPPVDYSVFGSPI